MTDTATLDELVALNVLLADYMQSHGRVIARAGTAVNAHALGLAAGTHRRSDGRALLEYGRRLEQAGEQIRKMGADMSGLQSTLLQGSIVDALYRIFTADELGDEGDQGDQ